MNNLCQTLCVLSLCTFMSSGCKESSKKVNTFPVNDTGITSCADETQAKIPCPAPGFPGQYIVGRDVINNNDSDGLAGFSFTKINNKGQPVDFKEKSWACIKDNVTGLLWETKTDNGLHDKNATFTWYQPDNANNGGNPGTRNGGTCTGSECDTLSFVAAVNQQGLCGFHDWRLPNVEELTSIVNYGHPKVAADPVFFPDALPKAYWSSEPTAALPDAAWDVYFELGIGDLDGKNVPVRIRLVRGPEEHK